MNSKLAGFSLPCVALTPIMKFHIMVKAGKLRIPPASLLVVYLNCIELCPNSEFR
jgi:hypothetical protein